MANDAATRVEKAGNDGGQEAAYKAFTAEVEQITNNSNHTDADQKILELTGALQKKGLLPEIETYWALKQDDLFGGDDKFDRNELGSYVEGKRYDAVSYALGNALKADYGRIKNNENNGGAYDECMFKNDLEKEPKLAAAKRFADELKADPQLYKLLSGLDGNTGSLSYVDLNKVRESIEINAKFGQQQALSEKQIALIKNVDWDTFKGLSGTWFDVCPEDLKKMPSFNPGGSQMEPSGDENNDAKAAANGGASKGATKEKCDVPVTENHDFAPHLMDAGSLPPEDHIAKYEIQAGQGFDRIARDILRREAAKAKEGQARQYTERDVLALSEAIAKFNGMKRADMLRMDHGMLNIPPLEWTSTGT